MFLNFIVQGISPCNTLKIPKPFHLEESLFSIPTVCVPVCVSVCICVCLHVCMYVSVYLYICVVMVVVCARGQWVVVVWCGVCAWAVVVWWWWWCGRAGWCVVLACVHGRAGWCVEWARGLGQAGWCVAWVCVAWVWAWAGWCGRVCVHCSASTLNNLMMMNIKHLLAVCELNIKIILRVRSYCTSQCSMYCKCNNCDI